MMLLANRSNCLLLLIEIVLQYSMYKISILEKKFESFWLVFYGG